MANVWGLGDFRISFGKSTAIFSGACGTRDIVVDKALAIGKNRFRIEARNETSRVLVCMLRSHCKSENRAAKNMLVSLHLLSWRYRNISLYVKLKHFVPRRVKMVIRRSMRYQRTGSKRRFITKLLLFKHITQFDHPGTIEPTVGIFRIGRFKILCGAAPQLLQPQQTQLPPQGHSCVQCLGDQSTAQLAS